MTATLVAYSLLAVTLVAGMLSVVAGRAADSMRAGPLNSYLLAGGTLGRTSVVSLLISSSFGLNALFYAAWLGYAIGVYALLVQLFWSCSFWLLAKYAPKIREHRSMHHFLGKDFGPWTRVVAGCCSLVGMMYLIGWESEIARLTFGNVLSTTAGPSPDRALRLGGLLATGTIGACLLYTVVGGLRGNALADKVLNLGKFLCVMAAIAVVAIAASRSATFNLTNALLPSRQDFLTNMGVLGFLTNMAFNIAWQFVDASSWQSIIAGRQLKPEDATHNLNVSGIAIFFVPGLIGTILGIFLHGTGGITPDNIIAKVAEGLSAQGQVLAIIGAVLIIACVMSLLDGMFLACAFTLVVDIGYSKRTLDELDENPLRAESILILVRVALVAVAVGAAWGVHSLMDLLDLSVFQFVYVVIITQLGLLGPILVGLQGRRRGFLPMWIPILASIGLGLAATWLGTHGWNKQWSDSAGMITALGSMFMAYVFSRSGDPGRATP